MFQSKISEAVEVVRIRQLICRVGDDGAETFKKDIQKVVDVIAEYYGQNKPDVRDAIVTAFLQCATLFPLKSGIYATVFALLSSKLNTQPLADQIISGLLDQLQLIAQEPTPILGQTLLKFLSELMNIGLLNTVSFVECLYDLEGGAENESSPFYLQILLTALPHTMIKAMEKNQIEFKNIIQNVEVLMVKRKQTDRLYYLWQAIRNFLNSNTQDNGLMKQSYPRPYMLFSEEISQMKQIRKSFKIPIVKKNTYWRPQQILVPLERVDTKSDMQNEILCQWIYETIELFKTNKQQLLLQFEYYQRCVELSPQQELGFKQILVYTLMNMVIDTNPRKDQQSSVFYSGLLSNLAQRDKAKEWHDLVDSFLEQVQLNNILIIDQLSDFLSHFICNSSFKVNWDKLFSKIQTTDDNTESGYLNNYFVLSTLRKLFTLVTLDKVKDLIPQNIVDWYTPQVDAMKYQEIKESETGNGINQLLEQKLQGVEMYEQLKNIEGFDNEYIVTVFLECLMQKISGSITHLYVLGKRYLPFLLQPKLVTQEKLGELLLNVIYNMWSHSIFYMKLYLKEFLSMEVISNLQIIRWLCNLQQSKLNYSELDESNKTVNVILSVNDILRKQTYLEQVQDINYENTLEIVNTIQNYTKTCKEHLILEAFEKILLWILILLKQGNTGVIDKLLKEQNLVQYNAIVQSF